MRKFIKSFKYAFDGIAYCVKNERNMRFHLFSALCTVLFSMKFGLTVQEYALLFITTGMVIICEMLNTAVETLVNLNTGTYNDLAKIAKDVAAGAVLISAVTAVFIGCFLFFRFPRFSDVITEVLRDPLQLAFVFFLLVFGFFFIFTTKRKN